MKKTIKHLIFLFIIISIIKSILSYFIPSPSIFADEYFYAKMARSIFYFQDFSVNGILTQQYKPLYPMILSISYIFQDMQIIYTVMKIINSFISSLVIFPIYFLSKEFLEHKKALVLSTMISLISINLVFPSYILSENLFIPLILFSIYFIFRSFQTNEKKYFILSGLFIGLSFLTRVTAVKLIPITLIIFLFKKTKFTNLILHYLIALITVLPWLIRNIMDFGFSFSSLLGYSPTIKGVEYNVISQIPPFINWFILYFGYLILGTGIFFAVYYLASFKNKDTKFNLLLYISTLAILLTILIAAYYSSIPFITYNSPFKIFTYRPMGRYIEPILPLIILMGFISYYKYGVPSKLLKRSAIITSIILLISTQLTIASLFPVNNQSISYLGVSQYLLELIFLGKKTIEPLFNWFSFAILAIILTSLPFILLKFKKRSKIVTFIFIFLILNSLLSYSIVYLNSEKYWYDSDHTQLGIFMNKHDPKISNILIDSKYEGDIMKKNQTALYERFKNSGNFVTIMGFWLNDNIIIGSPNTPENADFIITKSRLNRNLIKEINGIYIYETK